MNSQAPCWTLQARWVFPVAGPPLERGLVTMAGPLIEAVEPAGSRRADWDLGNVALLPGLVNAHTHLDLTGLRGLLPPRADFTGWLRGIVQHRRTRSPLQIESDIRAGLAESLAYGTTLLGDISSLGLSWSVLQAAPLRAVVFYELLGLPRARARQTWKEARDWLHAHPSTPSCRRALSPHAPYSVRAALFRAAAAWAYRHQAPLAIHLAETPAELELLARRSGPLFDLLAEVGVWDPTGLVRSVEEVVHLNRLVGHALFVHGNYLARELALPSGGSVVYCPRTHAAFGHAPHPLPDWLRRGVRVALGTDSLASNPDLDLLAEARFVHRQYPQLPGAVLLHMATLAGAEALGWQDEIGSLVPGKSADLVVLPLPDRECADPHDLVLDSSSRAQAVLCRGQWAARAPSFQRPTA